MFLYLVPCDIVPDFNRDGIIDNKDRGKITKDDPYRIWTNDDDDDGDVARGRSPADNGDDDVPTNAGGGYQGADWQSSGIGGGTVDGTRDLVDFFPLWLDIKQLVELLPTSQFSYYLKQADGALNFVYSELKPNSAADEEKAGAYLKQLGVAQQLQSAQTYQITAEGLQLTEPFIEKIKREGKGVILIEGRQKSNTPLKLEIRKDDTVVGIFSFEISIDGVEKMFRQKNLLEAGGGSGGNPDALGEPENYPDKLCSNRVFVFVHGYSTSSYQARGWFSELFKRLYWSESKAKFYGVNWYGNETQGSIPPFATLTPNYAANVDNAFATANALKGFLDGLGNDVTVAAHSLGSMVVSSAIHDWRANPRNYFMLDAAVAKEAYNHTEEQLSGRGTMGMEGEIHDDNKITSWLNYNRRLWCSDWHNLFSSSDNRSRLTWKGRLSNVVNASVYNFYSSGEDVLANPNRAPGVPTGAREVWNLQERLKGYASRGSILTSSYGGWKANGRYVNFNRSIWTPAQANQLTDEQLRTQPFFNIDSPTELYDENGSAYAADGAHRNTLLSEMVPALSFATGCNNLGILGETRNFDMMGMKNQGEWPPARSGQGSADWFHSDIKAIAFVYTRPVYDKMVELGDLKR